MFKRKLNTTPKRENGFILDAQMHYLQGKK